MKRSVLSGMKITSGSQVKIYITDKLILRLMVKSKPKNSVRSTSSKSVLFLSDMRECDKCGSTTTYVDKNGYSRWRRDPQTKEWLCSKCYDKYIHSPKFHEKWGQYYNSRQVKLGDKRVYAKDIPRTGVCSMCKRSVSKGEIDRTALHHLKYDDSDPLKYTIELCFNCHADLHTHKRQRNIKGQFT